MTIFKSVAFPLLILRKAGEIPLAQFLYSILLLIIGTPCSSRGMAH